MVRTEDFDAYDRILVMLFGDDEADYMLGGGRMMKISFRNQISGIRISRVFW